MDLLGEYIQCLKIYGFGGEKFIHESEEYLMSKQQKDGSWPPPDDNDDYYDIFHPVWTSIVALNYPSSV